MGASPPGEGERVNDSPCPRRDLRVGEACLDISDASTFPVDGQEDTKCVISMKT